MLTVRIVLVTEHTKEVLTLCSLLAEYNAQIREFSLTARTAYLAGVVVYEVFPGCEGVPSARGVFYFPNLQKAPYERMSRFPPALRPFLT